MGVDVIQFNEIKRNTNCYKTASGFTTCQNNYNTTLGSIFNAAQCSFPTLKMQYWNASPSACETGTGIGPCDSVSCVPCIAVGSVAGGFSVCDTSVCFNQGICCVFTVPSNARCVRFQLWGAGAGSAPALCCGFSIWGGTGAYASIIIPAVYGCQYTVCSGCAATGGTSTLYCVCSTPSNGCASFVNGYGLSGFCAEGGDASAYNFLQKSTGCIPAYCGQITFAPVSGMCDVTVGASSPYCICSNGNICANYFWPYISAPGSSGQLASSYCYISSNKCYYGSSSLYSLCNFSNAAVYGIAGQWSSVCVSPSVAYSCHPPIFNLGPAIMYCSGGAYYCGGYTLAGIPCCYPLSSFSGQALPGQGGIFVFTCGGQNISGSIGKMGMVCVQYV